MKRIKTAIFYQSILGTSKKYASWLSEELKADLYKFHQSKKINDYEQILIISGTYAAKMPLVNFAKKNWNNLKNKKLIILSVGISPPGEEYTEQTLATIPPKISKKAKIFRIPGNMFGVKPWGEVNKTSLKDVLKFLKN